MFWTIVGAILFVFIGIPIILVIITDKRFWISLGILSIIIIGFIASISQPSGSPKQVVDRGLPVYIPNSQETSPKIGGNTDIIQNTSTYPGYLIIYDTNKYDANVAKIQTQLNSFGRNIKTDGYFGNETLDAIKNFQKNNGLASDGVVGMKTWDALFNNASSFLNQPKEPSFKVAYIRLKNGDAGQIMRESDNAFRIYGETSDNCSKVVVDAYDSVGVLADSHQLTLYKYGNTSFRYGIREDWNNMSEGLNTYKFAAYCDNDQKREVSTTITFSIPAPTINDQNSYSGLSNDNYYTNSEGDSIHSPAYSNSVPAGASARCRDGTYSFSRSRSGTCSHHGGVADWL